MEAYLRRGDDLDGLDALFQVRRARAFVALETELHVFGRERVAVVKLHALTQRQQLPLYPKDPIRPMSASSLGAHFVPQESRLTPPAHQESKPGMLPWNFCPPLG